MSGALHWLELIDKPASAPAHIRLLYERLRTSNAPAKAPVKASTTTTTTAPATAAAIPTTTLNTSSNNLHYHVAVPNTQHLAQRPTPIAPAHIVHTPPAPLVTTPIIQPVHVQPVVRAAPILSPTIIAPVPVVAAPSHLAPVATTQPAPAPVNNNAAVVGACERLTAAVESLGNDNERSNKVSVEVAKRIPALRQKLEALNATQTDSLVALLESFTNALLAGDASAANTVYTDAQHNFHLQFGSTGMLALKRCLELVKK
jgi:hypothetical protein